MLIRNARETEIGIIKSQRINSYAQYKNDVSPEHWEGLKEALSSGNELQPGVDIFVAEIDGRIAGSAVLFPSQSKAYDWDTETIAFPEIRMLAVDKDYRSKGIGKALVQQCIDSAKQQNYEFIGLHTGSFMKNAIALYERMGFKRIPELDFVPFEDRIIVKAFRLNL